MTPYNQQFQPYSPLLQQNIPTQNTVFDTGIIWVQGESGAKAYPVQPGKSLALFDSETEQFFIKSVDISGMPQPLRTFVYTEAKETDHTVEKVDTSVFITREEFQQAMSQLDTKFGQRSINAENNNRGGNKNGKPLIRPVE